MRERVGRYKFDLSLLEDFHEDALEYDIDSITGGRINHIELLSMMVESNLIMTEEVSNFVCGNNDTISGRSTTNTATGILRCAQNIHRIIEDLDTASITEILHIISPLYESDSYLEIYEDVVEAMNNVHCGNQGNIHILSIETIVTGASYTIEVCYMAIDK